MVLRDCVLKKMIYDAFYYLIVEKSIRIYYKWLFCAPEMVLPGKYSYNAIKSAEIMQ